MIKILKENERAVVIRMGKIHRVTGPGVSLYVPIIDRLQVVDMDRVIHDWRYTSPGELNRMVEFLAAHHFTIPTGMSIGQVREEMRAAGYHQGGAGSDVEDWVKKGAKRRD